MRAPGIRTQLILILTVVLCIAFIATSVANFHVSRKAIHDELVTSSLPLTRDNIYSEIHRDLMRPIFIASLMANDAFLKEWAASGEMDVQRIQRYLADIRDKYGFISTFFISSKTLTYYHFRGVHKKISPQDEHDVWYYNFINMDAEYDLDIDNDEAADNRLTIFINFRVENDKGELLGVTGVGLELSSVARLLRSYQEKYGRQIYMTDARGKIQLHSHLNLVEKAYLADLLMDKDLAGRILARQAEPRDFEFERNERKILLTVRFMPELDWYLVVEQDEAGAIAAIRSTLIQNLAVGAVAIILVLVVVVVSVNVYQGKLERMATTDDLTGVANRRAFEERFERAVYRKERADDPFCIILIDLDGFKRVNDTLGHLAGDQALKAVAGVLCDQIRLTDLLARWGGDEFILLVSGPEEMALRVAARIREAILEASRAPEDDPLHLPPWLSASIGIAEHADGDNLDTLTRRADKALYEVKQEGGDAVQVG